MRARAVVCMCALLAGCGTPPSPQTARRPVPIACQEQIPPRPAMPTEALAPTALVHAYVVASQAEIVRREGYERQLVAALVACTKPLDQEAIED